MKYHIPTNVKTDDSFYLFRQIATCSGCGQTISQFEFEDDDCGIRWSGWAVNKDWGSPNCFGVSLLDNA